ncbi:Anoctamin-10 [Eumeta japonica]|uniref:Anoctamin n=1 Tax=Eumeta variegata TaxID=151549 RepID=A0A4C1ZHT0_EUMVA|nr:Anoctamin-10 [Eumeta japonica]
MAEDHELVKIDSTGVQREFIASQLDDFLLEGMHVEDLFTTAEKQTLIRQELENLRALSDDKCIHGYITMTLYEGKSIMQTMVDYGLISDIYSLHDKEVLKKLSQEWCMSFTDQPIDDIKLYFGESVALYFKFIGFYTTALLIPSILGSIQIFLTTDTLPYYCVMNFLWVIIFLEMWKRKSNELAFKWGTIGMTSLDEPQPNYRGKLGIDPISGKLQPQYPRWKTNMKMLTWQEKKNAKDTSSSNLLDDTTHIPLASRIPCLSSDDPRIEQANRECTLDEYLGTYDDYLELYIQFGYVILFSSVYPLAALFAVLNNVLEIRADAFKLCKTCKRPPACKVKNIGAWQRAFEIIGAMSIMTNCGLLWLSPKLRDYGKTMGFSELEYTFAFVVLEHCLLGIRYVLHQAIPEKPEWVRIALAKKNYIAKEALKKETVWCRIKTKEILQNILYEKIHIHDNYPGDRLNGIEVDMLQSHLVGVEIK